MNARQLWWRFWSKVLIGNECWEWQAACHRHGHGMFALRGRMHYAHRVAWELWYGPVPDGLFVLHRCDNPPCARPDHLFLGTQTDNMADAFQKGRMVFPVSANGHKTHCPKGHVLDGTKTYGGSTHRFCRTCKRAQDQAYRNKRKAVA